MKRLSGNYEKELPSRVRKPASPAPREELRCPACGRTRTLHPVRTVSGPPRLFSLRRLPGGLLRERLRSELAAVAADAGLPLFWLRYYCTACGGEFEGLPMFLNRLWDYARKTAEDQWRGTIQR